MVVLSIDSLRAHDSSLIDGDPDTEPENLDFRIKRISEHAALGIIRVSLDSSWPPDHHVIDGALQIRIQKKKFLAGIGTCKVTSGAK